MLGRMQQRRLSAWLVLLAALAASVVGFFWASVTGLPYQDATPEMLANQAAELRMAKAMFFGGLLACMATAVWLWKTRRNS